MSCSKVIRVRLGDWDDIIVELGIFQVHCRCDEKEILFLFSFFFFSFFFHTCFLYTHAFTVTTGGKSNFMQRTTFYNTVRPYSTVGTLVYRGFVIINCIYGAGRISIFHYCQRMVRYVHSFELYYIVYNTVCNPLDFVYVDFNDTTGIVFNGDAGTTVCRDDPLVCQCS
jgi:hypothetical protein